MKNFGIVLMGSMALVWGAQAAPKVGDVITFKGTQLTEGKYAPVPVTLEYSLTHFDANTGKFTLHSVETVGANTTENDEEISGDDLITEEIGAEIVEQCSQYENATLETLTVDAGTFNTCHLSIPDAQQDIWLAAVPFGLVQSKVIEDGTTTDVSLYSIVRGE